jgi:uncharacterized membrane protein
MNLTHVHLMLNHVPVLATAFGLGLLVVGAWRRSDELKKAALGLFVVGALLAVPVYLTGEPAEDAVEQLPGVSKAIIEQHEDAAAVAFTAIAVLGVAALAGLFLVRGDTLMPAWFSSLMFAASLVVAGLMTWTAYLGGQVRHTEIRSRASPYAVIADRNQ